MVMVDFFTDQMNKAKDVIMFMRCGKNQVASYIKNIEFEETENNFFIMGDDDTRILISKDYDTISYDVDDVEFTIRNEKDNVSLYITPVL